MIKVYVSRFDREVDSEPHLECYEIEQTPQMKVLDAINAINEKYDADISIRSSCRAGQCGSCGILFNGNGALACQKDIKDGAIIEPQNFPVIKDLIVDKSQIEQEVKDLQLSLNPQRHDDDLNENLTPENIKNTKKVRSCIECYSCFATCPVIKFIKTKFGGPYIMRYLSKFESDPRDEFDRLDESLKEGLYKCTSCGKCKAVCPKDINTFGDAIERLREIACKEGKGPLPEHVAFKENIEKTGRSIKAEGPSFIEEVKNDNGSKIALFTGCMVDNKLHHIGEALIDVLEANGITIDIPEGTWHDPCHLGSGQGIKGQPRDILKQIPGVTFKEMKYPCQCCGAGGGIKAGHPEIAMTLAKEKAKMIEDTGAESVITICPFCQYNIQDGLDAIDREDIKAMNIIELLQLAYQKD